MNNGQQINVGGIVADLDLNTGNLERGLARGRYAMDAIGREVQSLQKAFKDGGIGAQEFADRMNTLDKTAGDLADRMKDAYQAIGVVGSGLDVYNKQMAVGATGTQRFGRGMTQFGYILDDLQYSVSACVNNIQPFIYGLTGSAGWSAAAGIAVVSANQLYQQWDKLEALMGVSHVETEAQEMERLGKATGKTADETARYNKLKQKQSEIEQMRADRPKAENDRDKAVAGAIAEGDYDRVRKGVAETLVSQNKHAKLTPEAERKILDEKGGSETGAIWGALVEGTSVEEQQKTNTERARKALEDARAAAVNDQAESLLQRARHDPGALKELIALVDANPKAFPSGFAKDLEDQLPENQKQQTKWDNAGQDNAERFEVKERADREAGKTGGRNGPLDAAGRKANAGAAELIMPNIQARAAEVRGLVDRGLMSEDDAKTVLSLDLASAGMNGGDARDAAATHFEATDKGEAQDRQAAARRKNLAATRKKLPGVDRLAEHNALLARVNGVGDDKAQAALAEKLTKLGVDDPLAAADAAADLHDKAKVKAQGHIAAASEAAGRGQRAEEKAGKGQSEVYDAADLTHRIQASITTGDDEPKKQTGLLEKVVETLGKLADKNTVQLEVS